MFRAAILPRLPRDTVCWRAPRRLVSLGLGHGSRLTFNHVLESSVWTVVVGV